MFNKTNSPIRFQSTEESFEIIEGKGPVPIDAVFRTDSGLVAVEWETPFFPFRLVDNVPPVSDVLVKDWFFVVFYIFL